MDNVSMWAKGACVCAHRYYRVCCVRYGSAKRYIIKVQENIQYPYAFTNLQRGAALAASFAHVNARKDYSFLLILHA